MTYYVFNYVDTFNFDQPIYVIQENDGYIEVTLNFSIELREDTIVQFRYTNLSAIGELLCICVTRF